MLNTIFTLCQDEDEIVVGDPSMVCAEEEARSSPRRRCRAEQVRADSKSKIDIAPSAVPSAVRGGKFTRSFTQSLAALDIALEQAATSGSGSVHASQIRSQRKSVSRQSMVAHLASGVATPQSRNSRPRSAPAAQRLAQRKPLVRQFTASIAELEAAMHQAAASRRGSVLASSRSSGGRPKSPKKTQDHMQDVKLEGVFAQSSQRRVRQRAREHRLRRELVVTLLRREMVERLYEYRAFVRNAITVRHSSAMRGVVAAVGGSPISDRSCLYGFPNEVAMDDEEVAEIIFCAHYRFGVRPVRVDACEVLFRGCPAWRLRANRELLDGTRTIRAGLLDRWSARRGHQKFHSRPEAILSPPVLCHTPPISPSCTPTAAGRWAALRSLQDAGPEATLPVRTSVDKPFGPAASSVAVTPSAAALASETISAPAPVSAAAAVASSHRGSQAECVESRFDPFCVSTGSLLLSSAVAALD